MPEGMSADGDPGSIRAVAARLTPDGSGQIEWAAGTVQGVKADLASVPQRLAGGAGVEEIASFLDRLSAELAEAAGTLRALRSGDSCS